MYLIAKLGKYKIIFLILTLIPQTMKKKTLFQRIFNAELALALTWLYIPIFYWFTTSFWLCLMFFLGSAAVGYKWYYDLVILPKKEKEKKQANQATS